MSSDTNDTVVVDRVPTAVGVSSSSSPSSGEVVISGASSTKIGDVVVDEEEEKPYSTNILVVGAGQLGSRFLQGLAFASGICNFIVVDVSDESIKLTKARFQEVIDIFEKRGKRTPRHSLTAFKTIEDIPKELTYHLVVITTTSDVRRQVLETIVQSKLEIDAIILEKVLFQTLRDYDVASDLLKGRGLLEKTFVHHPRRYWSFYIALKRRLAKLPGCVDLRVYGTNWGLACNSIHFIDLQFMLNEGKGVEPHEPAPLVFESSKGLRSTSPSKRAGFKEISGVLMGRWADDSNIDISCTVDESKPMELEIEITHPFIAIRINELRGLAVIKDASEPEVEVVEFEVPVVSRLSGLYAQDLLASVFSPGRVQCRLPSYELSASLHKAFLEPLVRYFNKDKVADESSVVVPIT